MNLTLILADLYRRTGLTGTTGVATRMTSFVNTTHRQILALPGMDVLRDDTITFPSVASQAVYGLPPAITRIESITDRTTMRRLGERTLDDIRATDPGLVMTGPASCWIPRGWQQVQMQPAAATGLWAVSSSASDVTARVFVETIVTGGYPQSTALAGTTITGTTRVQLGTLTSHLEVVKFYLGSVVCVGAVSLYDAAVGGNELARIPGGASYARYLAIQLYPTPVSAVTYYADYVRTVVDMVNVWDEPLLPEDFHWLLVEGSLLKEWTKVDDDRRADAAAAYERGLSNLRYFVNCPPDFLPTRGRRGQYGSNRLGPYFGDTRWG